jgi:colanic acid/amylovoran biosynthesis glycosyltransferase
LRVLGRLIRDEELVVIGPDVVHFAFGVTARGSESIGRQLGCAVVVSFQGADLNYAGLEEDPGFYREVWRAADALHFLSEDLRRRAATRGYIDDDRARVILPGVDAASFVPPMRDRPHEGRLRVLSVGRLHWKKGYEYAMGALRELRDRGIDCCYRIVGSGEHREALLFARRDLGLDESVELAGAMPEAAVRDAMGWADVFLHPSTSEGFAYAVVEAQAMALPVVATDADGLSENVEHGSTGFVVGRRDAHALAEKIATLACDADLRRRMGEAGRERALRMFNLDREIGEFEDLYHRVAADRAR